MLCANLPFHFDKFICRGSVFQFSTALCKVDTLLNEFHLKCIPNLTQHHFYFSLLTLHCNKHGKTVLWLTLWIIGYCKNISLVAAALLILKLYPAIILQSLTFSFQVALFLIFLLNAAIYHHKHALPIHLIQKNYKKFVRYILN